MPAASEALASTEKVEYNMRRRLKLSVGSVKTASSYCSDTTGFFEFCWGGAPRDFWSTPSGDAGYNLIWCIKSMGCSSGSLKNTRIPASNSPHPNSDTYECDSRGLEGRCVIIDVESSCLVRGLKKFGLRKYRSILQASWCKRLSTKILWNDLQPDEA